MGPVLWMSVLVRLLPIRVQFENDRFQWRVQPVKVIVVAVQALHRSLMYAPGVGPGSAKKKTFSLTKNGDRSRRLC